MLATGIARFEFLKNRSGTKQVAWLLLVATGMLLPLGFAPFHLPGAAILGLSLFYKQIQSSRPKKAFFQGLVFGIGLFGLGVSWVSISIHSYGHLPLFLAYLITAGFVLYLALFPALCACLFRLLCYSSLATLSKVLLFSSIWCFTEYLRAICFTGFPWLSLGFGQIDTPLRYLLPITGIYGLSFIAVLAAGCLNYAIGKSYSTAWLLSFVLLLITPESLRTVQWSKSEHHPLTVGVIQANISMRDKWDEAVFWQIMGHYQNAIQQLMGKKQIILLPESAFPMPAEYIQNYLTDLHQQAKKSGTALLLGIPEAVPLLPKHSEHPSELFYNTLSTLGSASGVYRKQHLVPFGEYIPSFFAHMLMSLNLIPSDMQAGTAHQSLVRAHNRPFATLICYELAYPQLLRQQLPTAQWIVSLSDDGWFGHSLASYQHLQMAQALSILTSRYQIVANNDGLSSIISPQGNFNHTLPAFTSGILEGDIYPTQGVTPWLKWGDRPILGLCALIFLGVLWKRVRNQGN